MRNRTESTHVRAERRGFTLVQMLIALAILATLTGMLIVAMTAARRATASAADGQTAATVTTGLESFSTSFDFVPPLVRDKAKSDAKTIDTVSVGGSNVSVVAVYTPAADGPFLRGETITIVQANPLAAEDLRYSTSALGFYLAGVLPHPARSTNPDVPIDLVTGPGIGRPTLSGGFEKGSFGPYIEANSTSLKIIRNDDTTFPTAEVVDRNDVPVRYYRWLKDRNATKWEDLNIPAMIVGPNYAKFMSTTPSGEREQAEPAITAANWGIVMAGNNHVFGDESVAVLAAALRTYEGFAADDSTSEATLRARAWADNIVKVGNAPN
jgi:competence protein ComGC